MDNDCVETWLSSAGLEKYYPRFKASGVNSSNFIYIKTSEYTDLGVFDAVDRAKLSKLQQIITREFERITEEQNKESQNYQPSHPSHPSHPVLNKEISKDHPIPVPSKCPKIRVVVRKRPLNNKEKRNNESDIINVLSKEDLVTVHEIKVKVDLSKYVCNHDFHFDYVFDENSNNIDIYKTVIRDLVYYLFHGGRGTCFAYGQTGSGKTFTMMNPTNNTAQLGLYILSAIDIFKFHNMKQYSHLLVMVSFYEIYGGKLFDLLNDRTRLECREDHKHNEYTIKSAEDMMNLIEKGNTVRSTGSTSVNFDSSRSHAVLTVTLVDKTNSKNTEFGKLSFIDLAGSERAADTQAADRITRLEGAEINKSLLALKECIRALDQKSSHKPFRGSKLTQVLKDSLSGNARTVMIANISPNIMACEHTLNTLRYADRVKEYQKPSSSNNPIHNAYMPHMEKVIPQHQSQQTEQKQIINNDHNIVYSDDVYSEKEIADMDDNFEEELIPESNSHNIWNKQSTVIQQPSTVEEALKLEQTHELMLNDLGISLSIYIF